MYLCQSKDQSSGKAPISEIIAIFPERGEFVPSDYEVVRRRGVPANINTVRRTFLSCDEDGLKLSSFWVWAGNARREDLPLLQTVRYLSDR